MSLDHVAELALIEASRWQRAQAERLGLTLDRGKLVDAGQLAGAKGPSTKETSK